MLYFHLPYFHDSNSTFLLRTLVLPFYKVGAQEVLKIVLICVLFVCESDAFIQPNEKGSPAV